MNPQPPLVSACIIRMQSIPSDSPHQKTKPNRYAKKNWRGSRKYPTPLRASPTTPTTSAIHCQRVNAETSAGSGSAWKAGFTSGAVATALMVSRWPPI